MISLVLANKCTGARSCRMGDDELLELSGFVDPKVLMKALAKARRKMELKWIQFGQCSSFLYGPDRGQFQRETPPVIPPHSSPPTDSSIGYPPPGGCSATGIGYPFRYPG